MIVTRKALSRRSMLKGLGAAISLPVLDAMSRASAAAALTVTQPGAQSALPDRAAIDRLLAEAGTDQPV